ncbi:uncharacterized protein UTRI_01609 [Ustilago trichophora]|uniref:Uncharacterized protein n=1 Tax=Ustilago trichophora TaxID=86804 RepID=A0A5C3E052_9BASI|nr:uncharacterized protein UTRI_01609 [Ustilago trichophora]
MSEQECKLYKAIEDLRLVNNDAIGLLAKFDAIKLELQKLGYANNDYSLTDEYLQKFDPGKEFAKAIYHSRWDTFEGMQENFTAAQHAMEAACTKDVTANVEATIKHAIATT